MIYHGIDGIIWNFLHLKECQGALDELIREYDPTGGILD